MKTRTSTLIFTLGFLAFWANGDNYAAAPLLPSIAADLGLTVSRAAVSVTAYMLSFGLFTILFGPLGDKYGKGRIIKLAALGTSLFSVLGGFSWNLGSLVFFRSMNGIFGAGIFPVTMALIGSEFEEKERQPALAKVMGLMFLGGASATVIGGVLAQFGSWRMVYIVYGIAELLLSVVVVRLVPNGVVSEAPFNPARSHIAAFKDNRVLGRVATVFAVGFAVFGSFSYSGHYVASLTGLPIVLVGLVVTFFGIGTVASSRSLPILKRLFGANLVISAGLAGAASLLLLALPAMTGFSSLWLFSLGFFGFGFCFVILQSTLVMSAQDYLPSMRGTAMSLVSFGMFVGGGVGTQVNGVMLSAGGIASIYAVAAVLFLVAAFSLSTIRRSSVAAAR